jgi:hypothetical protein
MGIGGTTKVVEKKAWSAADSDSWDLHGVIEIFNLIFNSFWWFPMGQGWLFEEFADCGPKLIIYEHLDFGLHSRNVGA